MSDKQLSVTQRTDADALIARAIDQNVPVETMEKLLAMRRELKSEFAKQEFDKSMAKFQSECPIIEKKDSAGSSSFNYKYASLDHIVGQVKGILAKNGFSYTFDTKKENGALITYCHVKHKDGHFETSQFEIAIDTGSRMNISQKDGAASTYGKRYAFCNAFGILTGDEDTDAAQPITKPTQTINPAGEYVKPQITTTAPIQMIAEEQKRNIILLLAQKGRTVETLNKKIQSLYKKESYEELTFQEANVVVQGLNKMPDVTQEEIESVDPDDIPEDLGDNA
jgi:hypothetical protein